MFAKGNANGDLASGGGGGGTGNNGSINAYSRAAKDVEDFSEREELDEEDFSTMKASVGELASPLLGTISEADKENTPLSPAIPPSPTLYKPATNTMMSLLHYSHTNPAACLTTDSLEAQLKNIEFRTLFTFHCLKQFPSPNFSPLSFISRQTRLILESSTFRNHF
ncbi:hypothetical protein BCR33DRAFT_343777 [Rhizoclosmatium globosum]|uniref:Uncharacterized protein n=1 Tax=Rhizoclosmatium globosum TaxID=329046 RepID=A0A1Y2C2X2_9FUNG|nr:hypothetical protein BCR33DRAFT_343777 [Rhizoclosmatium globosum]|eukprot:ORY41296.1 hypothetical protein BCR33DRAFT_343777 [Rhizoclosmatium globosum]